MNDDPFPVEWLGRRAVVTFPARVDVSNVGQLRDRLLSVINRGAALLVADMTATEICDHAAVEAIARACQRAAISGARVRLVVAAPAVRRVLSIEGLDRLVSIYPTLESATAAKASLITQATSATYATPGWDDDLQDYPATAAVTPAVLWRLLDALGDGLLLASDDGKIALVNQRCAEMFGYRREELTGMPIEVLVPSEVRAMHPDYRVGYLQAPQTRSMAERSRLVALCQDGATLPVEISLSPVPTASENFVLAVIRDATEPRPHTDLADLARGAVSHQGQAARDLLDRVVKHLMRVGLSLQEASVLPGEVARKRLGTALDQLDGVIREIRNYAFTSGADPAPLVTGWSAS